jgi:hypothetical protein
MIVRANKKSKNDKPSPKRLALWLIVAIIAGAVLFSFAIIQLRRPSSVIIRSVCVSNLNELYVALQIYSHNYPWKKDDPFRIPENWCDLLVNECNVPPEILVCPHSKAKKGQSSYALNKNFVGHDFELIGPDDVIFFECPPGWNQIGGPEMWDPSHHDGKGCNVLTRRGGVYFERSPKGLSWGPEPIGRAADNAK